MPRSAVLVAGLGSPRNGDATAARLLELLCCKFGSTGRGPPGDATAIARATAVTGGARCGGATGGRRAAPLPWCSPLPCFAPSAPEPPGPPAPPERPDRPERLEQPEPPRRPRRPQRRRQGCRRRAWCSGLGWGCSGPPPGAGGFAACPTSRGVGAATDPSPPTTTATGGAPTSPSGAPPPDSGSSTDAPPPPGDDAATNPS